MSNKYIKVIRNPNEGIAWALKSYLGNFRKHQIIDVHKYSEAMKVLKMNKIAMLVLEASVSNQCSFNFVIDLRNSSINIPAVIYSKASLYKECPEDVLVITEKHNIMKKIEIFEEECFCAVK